MKSILMFLIIMTFFSCSRENKTSLKPLLVEYIDNIPYLMSQNKIDSVFEIISYGEAGHLLIADTLNSYSLNEDNAVIQKLKSFMCCSYVYKFDSLGLLQQKRVSTDYVEYFSFDRLRVEDVIYESESSNMGIEIEYKYQIENEKIVSRVVKIKGDYEFSDSTHYEYSNYDKIKTKIRIRLNDSNGDFTDGKIVTSYDWNQNVLKRVDIKQFLINDEIEPYFTTTISFDSYGFPIEKVFFKKQEIVCRTRLIRN